MDLNSSGEINSLFSKLTKGGGQCKRLEIDLNLPASSNETESTQIITNSDDEVLSWYAGTEIRRSEYEYQQLLNGRRHNDNSVLYTMDSSQKDASRKKNNNNSNVKWKYQVKVNLEMGLEVPPNDGYMWRKYGQKEILNAKYPREYYRCTYRNTHGCCATKQVQRSSQDPTTFDITYLGKHTCPKISKTNDTASVTESGYGLINFSSNSSRISDGSSAITRNSFELSNWPVNHSH